jgi:PhzF family phenazine biosynthesis protein
MTKQRPFKQVDVFTSVALLGNPVAVILDAAGLSDAQMQAVANWTNLSETTFVTTATDPGADYAVRIFTPRSELPFAGHPTLGTAHAVIEAGLATPMNGRIVQQCAAGLVEVSVSEQRLSFRLPRYDYETAPDVAALIAGIGGADLVVGTPQILNVGPRWAIAQLVSAQAVETLAPDFAALAAYERKHRTTGLTIFAERDDGIVVRSFAPSDGIDEDPVCGSGNAAVAAYRLRDGTIGDGSTYLARQGRQVGRDGYVYVRIDGSDVHVGGDCVTCVDGAFAL